MKNIFDFHFHLLFKHFISTRNNQRLPFETDFKTKGVMSVLDELMGNAFDSQSSPKMVKESQLKCGVTALLAMEYAFAENISGLIRSFSNADLPINWDFIDQVKQKKNSYFDLLNTEIKYYTDHMKELDDKYNIRFINRKTKTKMDDASKTYLAFSAEGAHNFSEAKIRTLNASTKPSENYTKIQDDPKNIDIFSINLLHLSEIPEQTMGGFAQGLTNVAQMAFHSADFTPKSGFGLSDKAKSFIKIVFTNKFPSLIDVKHMSVFTRYKFYNFREDLIIANPDIARLPIISSHTGFTFCALEDFLENKKYKTDVRYENGQSITQIQAKNQKIGKTNFLINNKLFANPWTINLFDEEIIEIMQSNGLIGLSMDQRILGSTKMLADGVRGEFFKDSEAIPLMEWRKWFKEGKLDLEGLEETESKSDREIRQILLLCHHMIYAVRLGYKNLNWVGNKSPWDHISIGSDYDGLINPINGYEDVRKLSNLKNDLLKYLPVADKNMDLLKEIKAFKINPAGNIDEIHLNECIDKFLSVNGKNFLERFLKNWQ